MANIGSLRNKVDMLQARLWERAYREACVISLTETWLDEAILDMEVCLDNFNITRVDRTKSLGKERATGVCVYINSLRARISSRKYSILVSRFQKAVT